MNYIDELLQEMRGENPAELEIAISDAFLQMAKTESNRMLAQIPSDKLTKGLSLIVHQGEFMSVAVYYNRKELGGFMPSSLVEDITSRGWTLKGDAYGQNFACVEKLFNLGDCASMAQSVTKVLYSLGAPLRISWKLDPAFSYLF